MFQICICHSTPLCSFSCPAPPPSPQTHTHTHSLTQEVICWSCAAALTCLVYTLTAPAVVNITYGTSMGLLFGLALYLLRGTLLEELYKVCRQLD